MATTRSRFVLFAAMGLCALGAVPHTVIAADAAKPVTIRLEPKQQQGVDSGKAVVVKGEAGPVPQRFLLEGISYMMPVGVALRPVDAGRQVAMDITKYSWDQPLRQGSTDGDILSYLFRTEGEFQVSVTAKQAGTPYRLLVWVAEETTPEFAPVVVKASEFEGDRRPGSWWPWALAGIVLVAAAVLSIRFLRRKSS